MKGNISEMKKLNPALKTKEALKMAFVSGMKHVLCLAPCIGLLAGTFAGLAKNADSFHVLAICSGIVNIGTIFAYGMKYRPRQEIAEEIIDGNEYSQEKTSFTDNFEDDKEME